jgi:hypothetical protein
LALFDDYGMTWDEPDNAAIGEAVFSWYATGFTDRRALSRGPAHLGGLFDAMAHAVAQLSPRDLFETRHLVNGLSGVAAAAGASAIASRLAGPRAGVWSILALGATPVFFGHAFNNPKDVPFAAFFVWGLAHLVAAVESFPRVPVARLLAFGAMVGGAVGIRIDGVLMIGLFGAAGAVWALGQWMARSRAGLPDHLGLGLGRLTASAVGAVGIAYVFMLLTWPAVQARPLGHPVQSLEAFARFSWNFPVLFEGRFVPASQLPWYYYLKWAVLTLPEFYLLMLAAGLWLASRALAARGRSVLGTPQAVQYGVVIIAAIGPYALTAGGRGAFDGLRHLLFTIPVLACLVACAFDALLTRWWHGLLRAMLVAVATLSWAVTVVDMIHLHPYETIFFTRTFAGGLPRAAGRYETDYWGNSYREGAEWLARHYPVPAGSRVRVGSCSSPLLVTYYLPRDRFDYVGNYAYRPLDDQPDVFIATTRWNCDRRFDGRVLYMVERQGVPLLYVKERSSGGSSTPAPRP